MYFYSRIADELLGAYPDCNIVMLPQVFCGREYALSDVDFFRDLAKVTECPRIIVTADCYSSDVQQTIIRNAKALFGSRYHSIVFAINQNVPFVALSYEHKIIGLLETLGKQNCCIDITNTFDSDEKMSATINTLKNMLPTIKNDANAQSKAKTIANNSMDAFVKIFVEK